MSTSNRTKRRKTAASTSAWKLAAVGPALAAALFLAQPAQAFLVRPAIFAAVGAATRAPTGWLQFCAENPAECQPVAEQARDVTLTPELLQQLYTVNAYANDRVKWTSDTELYNKSERWAYPLDRGDCEDIVLLKRRMLAKSGWPLGALLITTVEERRADKGRHAVLTVKTDRGEMILDNQTPEILFWYETSYRYLSRQSPENPNLWVAFSPDQPHPDAR